MRAAALLLMLTWLPAASTAAGEPPSYLILRAPAKPKDPHATHGYYPGRGYAVDSHAYNYGWFGAKPGRTWQRSTGYYRNYTEWSVR